MMSIAPFNEIKLVLLAVLLATPIVAGGMAGWVQQSGGLARLGGLAVGLLVGLASALVVVFMLYSNNPNCYCDDPMRVTFGTDPNTTGRVTLGWLALYPAKLGAAVITTWVVATWLLTAARAGLSRAANP